MITTHIIDDFDPSDKRVQVTFVNEQKYIHMRYINIPYLESGELDQVTFDQIIDDQIKNCNNKEQLGILTFVDPNEQPDQV